MSHNITGNPPVTRQVRIVQQIIPNLTLRSVVAALEATPRIHCLWQRIYPWITIISHRISDICIMDIGDLGWYSEIYWYGNSRLNIRYNYNDVKMSTMASQITSLAIVYSAVYSGTCQRKHQSSAPLAFMRGIHRWPVNSPHKRPVTRKIFPFDDVKWKFQLSHLLSLTAKFEIDETNTNNTCLIFRSHGSLC